MKEVEWLDYLATVLPADLSIIGLGLDIIGAVLIWRYGLPVGLLKSDGPFKAIAHPENEAEEAVIRRYESCSKWGVGLLIAGFALQLGGTVWSRMASNAASNPVAIHSAASAKTGDSPKGESEPVRKP